jgi:hypothetical protein
VLLGFAALFVSVTLMTISLVYRYKRHPSRVLPFKCPACGYPRKGSDSKDCPECGGPWGPGTRMATPKWVRSLFSVGIFLFLFIAFPILFIYAYSLFS